MLHSALPQQLQHIITTSVNSLAHRRLPPPPKPLLRLRIMVKYHSRTTLSLVRHAHHHHSPLTALEYLTRAQRTGRGLREAAKEKDDIRHSQPAERTVSVH